MVHHGDITRGSWPASTTHQNDFSSPLFPSAFSFHLLLPFPVAKDLPPFSVINLVFSLYLYFEILILYQDYKLLGLDGLESWDETNFVTHSSSHVQLVASLRRPRIFHPLFKLLSCPGCDPTLHPEGRRWGETGFQSSEVWVLTDLNHLWFPHILFVPILRREHWGLLTLCPPAAPCLLLFSSRAPAFPHLSHGVSWSGLLGEIFGKFSWRNLVVGLHGNDSKAVKSEGMKPVSSSSNPGFCTC